MSNELVPRKDMVKQALKGIGGAGGGLVLLILSGLSGLPGLIIGGILTLAGFAITTSKSDRTAGLVVAGAGILTLIAKIPFIGGLGKILMIIGGLALLGGGIYSLIQFFRNLKARS